MSTIVVRRRGPEHAGRLAEIAARTFEEKYAAQVPTDEMEPYLRSMCALGQVKRELRREAARSSSGADATTTYQQVGEALSREGWAGLVTRGAARPEGFVVCVLADKWPPDGCAATRVIEISEVPVPPTAMT